MEQENKDLLLRYLSMALPYKVKILYNDWDYDRDCEFSSVETLIGIDDRFIYTLKGDEKDEHSIIEPLSILDYKPFLRPISSMTMEEDITRIDLGIWKSNQYNGQVIGIFQDIAYANPLKFQSALIWLLQNHFDIFGLIPARLAIEVTEENNPYK